MVKIVRKWEWSEDYRKHATGHDRDLRKVPLRYEFRIVNRETSKEFRSENDKGLSYRMVQYAARISGNEKLYRVSVDITSGIVWFGDTPVSIPHFDWVPTVHDDSERELIAA